MKSLVEDFLPIGCLIALCLCLASLQGARAQPTAATGGGFYSTQHPDWPPLPANVHGLPQAEISPGMFLLDDENVDYLRLWQELVVLNALESAATLPPPPPGCCEEGTGGDGSGGGNGFGRLTVEGTCTGHLYPPVYQVTNLTLTLSNASGEAYDLYTTLNLNSPWTYLGRWTNSAAPWVVTNPPVFESYYTVGCTNDADDDWTPNLGEILLAQDSDYDGQSDAEETWVGLTNDCTGERGYTINLTAATNPAAFTPKRLTFFRFNTADLAGERGQQPLATNQLGWVEAWATKGVQLRNGAAQLKYLTVETNATANINLRSGTVRFWFQPAWTSGSNNAPAASARLLEVGAPNSNGWWTLYFGSGGSNLFFVSQTNGASATTNLSAGLKVASNQWYQITLSFTNGAIALYTNGVLVSTNANSFAYPGLEVRTNGFALGSDMTGSNQAKGVFEDFETFNWPLCVADILTDYDTTQPPDLIAGLRMWLKADADVRTNSSSRVDSWLDRSGNANHASQQTAASQPFYKQNAFGDRPSIYFAGSNSIAFTLTNTLLSNLTEAEAFVVMQARTNLPAQQRGLWRIGANSYHLATDGHLRESFGAATPLDTSVPAQRVDQSHIFNTVAASNEWTLRLNGVVHFSRNTNSVLFSSSPLLGNGGAGGTFEGYVSEVLLFARRLSAAERFAVGAYLAQRYQVVTNPPVPPTCLTAFAVSTNQVSLAWSGPLSNTNLTHLLQRRVVGGQFQTIDLLDNALSYLDTGLEPNTVYEYRVRAANFAGDSDYSRVTSATTQTSGVGVPLGALQVWLRAGAGHGGNPVTCWVDQTTNNYPAFFKYNDLPEAPLWVGSAMNGRPALAFHATNGFSMPEFTPGWTEGEAFVIVKSFGAAPNQYSPLWQMSPLALPGWYPDPNGAVWENFGRGSLSGSLNTGSPTNGVLTNAHLYNVQAATGVLATRFNNVLHFTNNINQVGFSANPRLGWGANGAMFRGYISEVMFFKRNLSADERNAVVTNYLFRRYNLP